MVILNVIGILSWILVSTSTATDLDIGFSRRPGNVTAVSGVNLTIVWLLQPSAEYTVMSFMHDVPGPNQPPSHMCYSHDQTPPSNKIISCNNTHITVSFPPMNTSHIGHWKLQIDLKSGDYEDPVHIKLTDLQASYSSGEPATVDLMENKDSSLEVRYEPMLSEYVLRLPDTHWRADGTYLITADSTTSAHCQTDVLDQRTEGRVHNLVKLPEGTSLMHCLLNTDPQLLIQFKMIERHWSDVIVPNCPENRSLLATIIILIIIDILFGRAVGALVIKKLQKLKDRDKDKNADNKDDEDRPSSSLDRSAYDNYFGVQAHPQH